MPSDTSVRAQLPAEVSTALDRRTGSVLVDAEQLAAARARFDDTQAESLARYLGSSQSANTVRAYRADWHGWLAWCASQGRTALPADALDVAVYLAAPPTPAARTTPAGPSPRPPWNARPPRSPRCTPRPDCPPRPGPTWSG